MNYRIGLSAFNKRAKLSERFVIIKNFLEDVRGRRVYYKEVLQELIKNYETVHEKQHGVKI